ncbi:hypothetical protein SEVIR_8G153701v4 [Setaria viridis]
MWEAAGSAWVMARSTLYAWDPGRPCYIPATVHLAAPSGLSAGAGASPMGVLAMAFVRAVAVLALRGLGFGSCNRASPVCGFRHCLGRIGTHPGRIWETRPRGCLLPRRWHQASQCGPSGSHSRGRGCGCGCGAGMLPPLHISEHIALPVLVPVRARALSGLWCCGSFWWSSRCLGSQAKARCHVASFPLLKALW